MEWSYGYITDSETWIQVSEQESAKRLTNRTCLCAWYMYWMYWMYWIQVSEHSGQESTKTEPQIVPQVVLV